jgi:polysaccharide biosynthesis transport protein
MNELQQESEFESPPSSLNAAAILHILFKHKWKIFICAVVGLIASATTYFLWPPIYVSQAKLLVRYVVDKSAIDPVESAAGTRREGDSIINSEVEILTSWDLAVQVAETVGVKRFPAKPGSKSPLFDAAFSISKGLTAVAGKGTNVILVSFKNPDPELAVAVLTELIESYFKKHLEVHRSTGAFEFVSQQNLLVQGNLRNTEDLLRTKKAAANIISLEDSLKAVNAELSATRDQLHAAEAELAEQTAIVKQMEPARSESEGDQADAKDGKPKKDETTVRPPDSGDVLRYQALVKSLAQARELQSTLLAKYTSGNQLVKLNQAQIDDLEKQRRALEKENPDLTARVQEATAQGSPDDYRNQRARVAGLEAKVQVLRTRLQDVQTRVEKLTAAEPEISELERKKQLEENSFKTSSASLERARIDEALDPSKMPNISMVQKPSPALRDSGKMLKTVLGLAAGGLALGIGLVLLIELLFDRSIKRPLDIETVLGIPLMVSIPNVPLRDRLRLKGRTKRDDSEDASGAVALVEADPTGIGHSIRPFAAAIRDRLMLYFDRKKVVHNPKLVAVTGCSGGEGASTVAAGLAAALSETGGGKILLVDMNVGHASEQALLAGRPTCSLSEVIEGGGSIPEAADNLYLAKVPPSAGSSQLVPKRFYDLVPRFKATDFDYIIFDMPPIAQSGVSLAMSGFMDKVLLVVEAEQSNRDVVKRAYSELIASHADVSAVVNKTRSYVPRWIEDEQPGSIAVPTIQRDLPGEVAPSGRLRAAIRSIFWVGLFLGFSFFFLVIFEHGLSDLGANALRKLNEMKGFTQAPSVKPATVPAAEAAVAN